MRLSVIIPAFNESSKILLDLRENGNFLLAQKFHSEVLVVDDGSADDTAEIVRGFIREWTSPKVKFELLTYGKNHGKGYAVRYGIEHAQGEIVAFMDSGLCVPVRYLLDGIEKIEQGSDFAIASRRLSETRIHRAQPLYRKLGSKAFHVVVQTIMGVHVSDTQCGFKLYKAAAAKQIYSRVTTEGFMFDIEALVIASKLGLKRAEFPIEWTNDSDTRYNPILGTLRNLKELTHIRLKWLGKRL